MLLGQVISMSHTQEDPNSHIAGKFLYTILQVVVLTLRVQEPTDCMIRDCITHYQFPIVICGWVCTTRGCFILKMDAWSRINELLLTISSSNGFIVLADIAGSSTCLQTQRALNIHPCICSQASLGNDGRGSRTDLHASIRYHPAHDLV